MFQKSSEQIFAKKVKVIDERTLWKKETKCKIPTKVVRSVAPTYQKAVGEPECRWLERRIEQLAREKCLPLQLISSDFVSLLSTLLPLSEREQILQQLRDDFLREHP